SAPRRGGRAGAGRARGVARPGAAVAGRVPLSAFSSTGTRNVTPSTARLPVARWCPPAPQPVRMSWMPTPEPDTHVDPGLPFRPADAAEAAEAGRLCSAGLIRRVVADAFVAADVPDSPTLRARAAALVLPERLAAAGGIVGFASAAWVHTGWHPEG